MRSRPKATAPSPTFRALCAESRDCAKFLDPADKPQDVGYWTEAHT